MRIVIEEIDGGQAPVTITRGDDTNAVSTEEAARTAQRSDAEAVSPQDATVEARDAGPAPAVGEAATTVRGGGTEAAAPQAAALGDRDAGPVSVVAESTPGVPPLPLTAPGPDAPVAGRVDDLSAGAAPGIPLEPPPAIRSADDATEGGQ